MISDQGREFVCKSNAESMKLAGTDHHVTSAYHPQSNGLCEQLNQTIQNIQLKRVNDNQDDWDELLPAALFAIRTSKQKSTQYSPFQMMFGRCSLYYPIILVIYCTCDTAENQSFTMEVEFECTSEENMEEHGMEEVFGNMLEMKHKMFDDARKNIHKAQERYKKDFDKKKKQIRGI